MKKRQAEKANCWNVLLKNLPRKVLQRVIRLGRILKGPAVKLKAARLDHLIEAGKRVVAVIARCGNRVDFALSSRSKPFCNGPRDSHLVFSFSTTSGQCDHIHVLWDRVGHEVQPKLLHRKCHLEH